jgi:hypothetical protein
MKYIAIAMLILLSGCYDCNCHAEREKEREREAMRASLGLVNVGAATVSNRPVCEKWIRLGPVEEE